MWDNILIDEARTPLIISGPSDMDLGRYGDADKVARQLKKEEHFSVDEKQHNVSLTDEGVREAEKLAGVESFYTAGNMEWPHLIDNALKAHYLYKKDVNYVIKDGGLSPLGQCLSPLGKCFYCMGGALGWVAMITAGAWGGWTSVGTDFHGEHRALA